MPTSADAVILSRAALHERPPTTQYAVMATPALKSQISAKFTEAFNRLNKTTPGGVLEWSQVSMVAAGC